MIRSYHTQLVRGAQRKATLCVAVSVKRERQSHLFPPFFSTFYGSFELIKSAVFFIFNHASYFTFYNECKYLGKIYKYYQIVAIAKSRWFESYLFLLSFR